MLRLSKCRVSPVNGSDAITNGDRAALSRFSEGPHTDGDPQPVQ